MIRVKATVEIEIDNIADVVKIVSMLRQQEVLVGVPEAKTARKGMAPTKVTNALIARVQDQGSQKRNIPPRAFLSAGIIEGKDKIAAAAKLVGQRALDGKPVDMSPVGLVAVNVVRAKITRGPFAPLALSTIRRRKAKGMKPPFRPLIATGQMRNAQNYVIVKKK
jgi:hypothetical protein